MKLNIGDKVKVNPGEIWSDYHGTWVRDHKSPGTCEVKRIVDEDLILCENKDHKEMWYYISRLERLEK